MILKIKSKDNGANIYAQIYSAPEPDRTFALNGSLFFNKSEWKLFSSTLFVASLRDGDEIILEGDESSMSLMNEAVEEIVGDV